MSEEFLAIFVAPMLLVIAFVTAIGAGLGVYYSNAYKYNCNLQYGPSIKTVLLINDNDFGYDPEGFCSRLKAKMEKE